MNSKRPPLFYKGRSLGIVILTVAQLFIGVIHFLFGLLLLAYESSITQTTVAYDVYTLVFATLVIVFAIYIWEGKSTGWIGTVAVSLFVIAADSLVVLNLPSIPGIPKFAAPTEIVYSLTVLFYLFQKNIRKKYLGWF